MKLVRVGGTIYGNGKIVVAEFVHGMWYRSIDKKSHIEKDPCNHQDQATYNAMPDCLTLPLAEGEEMILAEAERALPSVDADSRARVLDAARQGILKGLRKYGPYDPVQEQRNLVEWAMEEERDTIVYSSMLLAAEQRTKQRSILNRVINRAAQSWLELETMR